MKTIKLGELIKIYNGRNYGSIAETGAIPVYGSGGIMGYTDKPLVDNEVILLPRKGSLGNIYYHKGKFWNVDTIYAAAVDKTQADAYFLYHYLNAVNLLNLDSGSTLPSMTQGAYNNIKIELPDLAVQKDIASTLRNLDNKVALNEKINAKLEKIARLIYDQWFVQFDFPDENNRPYKTSGGAMVFDNLLKREIPANWQVKRVADFVNVMTGKEDANFATDNGKYAYFTCGREILKCDKAVFDGKSVLIAGNGTFEVKYYDGKFNAYQRTYVLTPTDDRYVGLIYRNAIDSVARFAKGSNGSIVKFITKGDVENIKLLIPDNDELLKPLNMTLDFIETNNKESQKLAEFRNWLLPMLMNGQIKVS